MTRYGFIHALYQNVLYERLSPSRRVQLHRRIGEHGEALYGERASEMAAELAMHFERGANYGQAVKYLQQAAENAIRRFAYREAVGLSRRGLEMIQRLPETPERAAQELRLHITLGVPLIATEGYAAPDVGSTYTIARELCRQLGEPPEISQVLWGLWTFHTLRGELGTAREIAEEFLRLAERFPYPGLAMRGHWAMEITFMHLGEFSMSMEHFEKALSLYDPERHRDDAFLYAQNPGVAMRCFGAVSLWFLGRADRSLDLIQEAVRFAHELSEPHGLAHALFFRAFLHQLRREERRAQEYAEKAIAVSSEHGLVLYQAMATVIQGWALSEQGRHSEAIEKMRQGIDAHEATGTEVLVPHFWALLAESLGRMRQTQEGLGLLEKAVVAVDGSGEQYYLAELYRLKGELLLTQPAGLALSRSVSNGAVAQVVPQSVTDAEGCFRQSIEIARRQKAKSLELRAAMNLARLCQRHGRSEEGRRLLAQIHEGFTEGFDSADLCDASALLDELL